MTVGDEELEMFNAATSREPGVPEQETNEQPVAPAPKETEAQPEGEVEAPEGGEADTRERDASGKFVAKKEGEEAGPPAERQTGIPSGRLREESEAKRAAQSERDDLKRQLSDMQRQIERLSQPVRQPAAQPAQPAPNLFENPDGYIDQRLRPIQESQTEMIDRFSRMMAVQSFGRETVDAAFKELATEVQANPAARFEAQRIWQSEHPYAALVEWHKGRETLREIGSDPKAYQQKLREQLLTDPDFVKQVIEQANGTARQAPAAGNGRSATTIAIPPSLNSRNGAGADTGRAPAASEAEEFNNFFAR